MARADRGQGRRRRLYEQQEPLTRPSRLPRLLAVLRRTYGRPERPPSADPFHLVLWEQCAYLRSDDQRKEAYEALRRATRLDPRRILATPLARLTAIAAIGGVHPELRAQRMQTSAAMIVDDFGGDLNAAAALPFPDAVRALMRFPMIGRPGAEKILLLVRAHPRLALDSNALRVLNRIGYGRTMKGYDATYRSAQAAAGPELGTEFEALIDATLLLKHHGQATCTHAAPRCDDCAVRAMCDFYQRRPS